MDRVQPPFAQQRLERPSREFDAGTVEKVERRVRPGGPDHHWRAVSHETEARLALAKSAPGADVPRSLNQQGDDRRSLDRDDDQQDTDADRHERPTTSRLLEPLSAKAMYEIPDSSAGDAPRASIGVYLLVDWFQVIRYPTLAGLTPRKEAPRRAPDRVDEDPRISGPRAPAGTLPFRGRCARAGYLQRRQGDSRSCHRAPDGARSP